MKTSKISLLLDSARGVFIPRDFVTCFDLSKFQGIKQSYIEACKNPDCSGYWEAWEGILDNASYVEDGRIFTLHQDGDLWLLCVSELSAAELANFGFDE